MATDEQVPADDARLRGEAGSNETVLPRRAAVLACVASAVVALDVITKAIVVAKLEGHPPVSLLGGLLRLHVIRNAGAAFGFGAGLTVVFSVLAAAVAVVIIRTARRLRSRGWALALGLILGGAVGNLIDRVVRAPGFLHGHVVDWIQLPYWPIFNLADSAIVCGGAVAIVLAFRGIGIDGTRVGRQSGESGDASQAHE
ncbi:MAG: signal peptidase II [Streptosporangiales bacterium]